MTPQTEAPTLSHTKLIYEGLLREKAVTVSARQMLVCALLATIVAVSALIAVGWLVLAVSGVGISLSYGVLGACGLHLLVIGVALTCAAAQILVHTFSKARHEELEGHWAGIYQAALVTPENVRALYERLSAATPGIEGQWRLKLRLANSVAWILGALSVFFFVTSLAADIYIGATLEYTDACEDANYTLNAPAPTFQPLVQFQTPA